MTAVNGHQHTQELLDGADLTRVREQVLELLARLTRPPRNLRVEAGGVTIDLTWDDAADPGARTTVAITNEVALVQHTGAEAGADCLRSPAVGVFYHAREPGAEPFAPVGSTVRARQQIGVIEVMKMMIPVEADRAGRITAVLKGNGEHVEYDEPIFAIEAGKD